MPLFAILYAPLQRQQAGGTAAKEHADADKRTGKRKKYQDINKEENTW